MILQWYENTWFCWEKWRLILLLFWIINRNFLKILIKFDRIHIFQGFESILEGYFDDFSAIRMDKNGVKCTFCRTHYRTRKYGSRRGNNRYAVSGFRTLILKCKPCPMLVYKTYYNSTVLLYVLCYNLHFVHFCNLSY